MTELRTNVLALLEKLLPEQKKWKKQHSPPSTTYFFYDVQTQIISQKKLNIAITCQIN